MLRRGGWFGSVLVIERGSWKEDAVPKNERVGSLG